MAQVMSIERGKRVAIFANVGMRACTHMYALLSTHIPLESINMSASGARKYGPSLLGHIHSSCNCVTVKGENEFWRLSLFLEFCRYCPVTVSRGCPQLRSHQQSLRGPLSHSLTHRTCYQTYRFSLI